MRRITVEIDEALFQKLERVAAREGRSVQRAAAALLREGLCRSRSRGVYRLRLEGHEAELRPGVDVSNRRTLFERLGDG